VVLPVISVENLPTLIIGVALSVTKSIKSQKIVMSSLTGFDLIVATLIGFLWFIIFTLMWLKLKMSGNKKTA
jgi:hypothetical protein